MFLPIRMDPPHTRQPRHTVAVTLPCQCREQWDMHAPAPMLVTLAIDGQAATTWQAAECAPGRWHLRELGDGGDGVSVDTFARTCSCLTWRVSPSQRPCVHVYAAEALEQAVAALPVADADSEDAMPVVRIADAHESFDPAEYARWVERASDDSDLATLLAWARSEQGSPVGFCRCAGDGRVCLACRVAEIVGRRAGR